MGICSSRTLIDITHLSVNEEEDPPSRHVMHRRLTLPNVDDSHPKICFQDTHSNQKVKSDHPTHESIVVHGRKRPSLPFIQRILFIRASLDFKEDEKKEDQHIIVTSSLSSSSLSSSLSSTAPSSPTRLVMTSPLPGCISSSSSSAMDSSSSLSSSSSSFSSLSTLSAMSSPSPSSENAFLRVPDARDHKKGEEKKHTLRSDERPSPMSTSISVTPFSLPGATAIARHSIAMTENHYSCSSTCSCHAVASSSSSPSDESLHISNTNQCYSFTSSTDSMLTSSARCHGEIKRVIPIVRWDAHGLFCSCGLDAKRSPIDPSFLIVTCGEHHLPANSMIKQHFSMKQIGLVDMTCISHIQLNQVQVNASFMLNEMSSSVSFELSQTSQWNLETSQQTCQKIKVSVDATSSFDAHSSDFDTAILISHAQNHIQNIKARKLQLCGHGLNFKNCRGDYTEFFDESCYVEVDPKRYSSSFTSLSNNESKISDLRSERSQSLSHA